MGRRTWIKIYCDPWLRGSIRQESSSLRGTFGDLIAMAGDSVYGDDGIIQLADNVGFNDASIAGILNIPLAEWQQHKARLSDHPAGEDENRIEIIDVKIGYIIKVVNFPKYQAEYTRQKPYRKGKKLQKKLQPELQSRLQIEGEGEGEGDKEREEEGDILGKKEIEILHLLQNTESYPFEYDKDIVYVKKLIEDYPSIDVFKEVKKKCSWWLDHPILKKHNPRLQLRNWMEKEVEFQKERTKENKVGHRSQFQYTPPSKKEIEFLDRKEKKIEELREEHKEEMDIARTKDEREAVVDKIRVKLQEWEKDYWKWSL